MAKKKKRKGFSLEDQIKHLGILNKRGKLGLFIGAGVSSGCGLPDWNSLLEKIKNELTDSKYYENHKSDIDLTREYFDFQFNKKVSDCLYTNGIMTSPKNKLTDPINLENYKSDIADLAREYFGSHFNKKVSDCLYANGVMISPTLKAIVKSGVKRIITLNFDDLLGEALKTEGIEHKILLNGESFNGNYPGVHVFHPHGYLDRFATDNEYKHSKIILSESDYEILYNNHYCPTNLIQLSILINHSVLFVGMSLSDKNTNRLLKEAVKIGVRHKHYAFFKNLTEDEQEKKTDQLKKLGVEPIWIPDYSKILDVFQRIKAG